MRQNIPVSFSSNDAKENFKQLEVAMRAVSQILLGGINVDNFQGQVIYVTRSSGSSSSEISVPHGLNKTPSNYIVINSSGFGGIKKGTTAWTPSVATFFTETTNDNFSVLLI